MSRRSAIAKMPIEIRKELNERLLVAGFGEYVALADEFTRRGYAISKSALHRYGQRLGALARETEHTVFKRRLCGTADNGLPMTVVTIVDLQSGEARVLTTSNPIADVIGLLDPLEAV